MRNDYKNKSLGNKVLYLTKDLPYFSTSNLKIINIRPDSLRMVLYRLAKRGDLVRLKKGLYTNTQFVDKIKKENRYSDFLEFLANRIYHPSYLSSEYVLSFYNVLTEMPANFTSITKRKTKTFSNELGNFIYRHVKDSLFLGFDLKTSQDFIVKRASLPKALFDFLYSRKADIVNEDAFQALRLNLDVLTKKDKKKLERYISIEGSGKMKQIYEFGFH